MENQYERFCVYNIIEHKQYCQGLLKKLQSLFQIFPIP